MLVFSLLYAARDIPLHAPMFCTVSPRLVLPCMSWMNSLDLSISQCLVFLNYLACPSARLNVGSTHHPLVGINPFNLTFLAHNTLYTSAFSLCLFCSLCFVFMTLGINVMICRVVYSYPYLLFGRLVSLCERCLDEVK